MSGISYIGGAGGPYLVGYLGSLYGLEKSMWIDPLFSISLAMVALLWFLREKREVSVAISRTEALS
jgi:hypothetical protein